MNWADFAILAVIAISVVISVFRGFVREVLSILAWVLAFWIAFLFTDQLAGVFDDMISVPSVRYVAAFLVLLIATLIVAGITNHLITRLIDKTGLSGTDRMLGVVFGVMRGIVIIGILVILARATPVTQDPWWRESALLGHFDDLAVWAIDYFPDNVAKYFE